VTKNEADLIERHVVSQHLSGCGMPQQVGSSRRSLYARADQSVLNDGGDPVGSERSLWRDCAHKHGVVRGVAASGLLDVTKQSFADVLRHRQPNLIPAFPTNK
jgi:hypothetical protein